MTSSSGADCSCLASGRLSTRLACFTLVGLLSHLPPTSFEMRVSPLIQTLIENYYGSRWADGFGTLVMQEADGATLKNAAQAHWHAGRWQSAEWSALTTGRDIQSSAAVTGDFGRQIPYLLIFKLPVTPTIGPCYQGRN